MNGWLGRLRRVRRPPADAGNAPLELVILAPVVIALIGLVIAAGRTTIAQGSVDAAARDAARQASIARTAPAARTAAVQSARAELAQEGLDCAPAVTVNLAGFGVPVGTPATVSATVSCQVSLSNLLVPGLPGSRTLTATFTSPLDPYRGRVLAAGLRVTSARASLFAGGGQGGSSPQLALSRGGARGGRPPQPAPSQ
jgi:Flp pilus assembly protein TadG